MRKLLMTGSVLAAFGTSIAGVSSVELVANANGTRINLNTGSELLSRSRIAPDGSLVLEVLGATSSLSGSHSFGTNEWFSKVEARTIQKNGHSLLELRFKPTSDRKVSVLHREWNGKNLSFVLDRKAASKSIDLTWSTGQSAPSMALASLQTQASLLDAQIKASGDMETIELRFDEAPLMAELIGAGDSYSILLGKTRLSAKLGKIGGDFTVSSLASGKAGNQNSLNIKLKGAARSVLLSRSGSMVLVRILRAEPAQGLLTWSSKSGKANQFGKSALPSDEVGTLASIKSGSAGKETFTPDGMSGGPVAADQTASGATAQEAAGLEAERRKSMEFSAQQQAKANAKQSAEDLKNRVVYNTFGIRDPFIPLEPGDVDGGLNIDQMKVAGIIFSPTRPMAVLEHLTQPGLSVALREGDAIQNGRVLKIYRDQVVFLLEEYGVTRQFALKLQAPKGDKS